MKKSRDIIAIIGGGSVGTSLLIQLIDEAIAAGTTHKLAILLFEPQSMVGPGYAYQADFECNLLNTRADTMSAISKDKNHFIKWLQDNEAEWRPHYPNITITPDAFLPRSLFGRYLHSVYQLILDKTKEYGIPFHHVQDEVIDIVPINTTQSCLDTRRSGGFIANRFILCLGNLPSDNFKHLIGTPGYFNSPYPCQPMTQTIPSNASVCVIGTSLSAIDAVLSLKEAGHQGNIICVSRNGRLPSVRGSHNKSHQLKHLTKERINNIIENNSGVLTLKLVGQALLAEYEELTGEQCNLEEILNSSSGMHDYLTSEIKLSSSYERIWQSIIYATNNVIDYIWYKLTLEDKQIFDKFIRSQWLAYRVSFPLANALKIRELLRTEQLRVFGGMQSISYDENEKLFSIHIHDKRTGLRSIIQSDYVVNATCFSLNVNNTTIPLIQNLLKRGLATAHEFGGVNVDYETGALISTSGQINKRVTTLGSLSAGVYFWTNAMDVNARLALKQARQLIQALKQAPVIIPILQESKKVQWNYKRKNLQYAHNYAN